MEVKEKKVLVYAISTVLVIAVILNFYHGSTVTKIDIPGLLGIEFNSNNKSSVEPDHARQNQGENNDIPVVQNTPSQVDQPLQSSLQPDSQTGYTEPETRSEPDHQASQTPQLSEPNISIRLAGSWIGEDGSEYEIEQTGNTISFVEYGLWGVTASGSGSITGNQIVIDYQTAFGTFGNAVLEVSGNQQILTGYANDLSTGVSTRLILHRN